MKTNIISFLTLILMLCSTTALAQSPFFNDDDAEFSDEKDHQYDSAFCSSHAMLTLSVGGRFPLDTLPDTRISINDVSFTVGDMMNPDWEMPGTDFDLDSATMHIANADADIYIYFIDKSTNAAKETGRNMAKGIMPHLYWENYANNNQLSIHYGVSDSLPHAHTTTCLTVSGNYTDSTPTYSSFAFWDLRYVNYYAVVEVVGDRSKRAEIDLMQQHCDFSPEFDCFTEEALTVAQMDSVGDGFEYLYAFVLTMQAYVPSNMPQKREKIASLPYYAEYAYEQTIGHAPASLAYNKSAATASSPLVQPAANDRQQVQVPQSSVVYQSQNGNFKITAYTSDKNTSSVGSGSFDLLGRPTNNGGGISFKWTSK
ncbi:MAG: hypothetical protein ACI3Z8_06405 [Paludibacteraceae bacterium]